MFSPLSLFTYLHAYTYLTLVNNPSCNNHAIMVLSISRLDKSDMFLYYADVAEFTRSYKRNSSKPYRRRKFTCMSPIGFVTVARQRDSEKRTFRAALVGEAICFVLCGCGGIGRRARFRF